MDMKIVQMNKKNSSNEQKIVQMSSIEKNSSNGHKNSSNGQKNSSNEQKKLFK